MVSDSLGSGGAQNQLTLLAVGLKKQGHDVEIGIYFKENFFKDRLTQANIPVFFTPKQSKIGLGVVYQWSKRIRQKKYKVVIAFQNTPNIYATLAKKLSGTHPILIVSYRSKTNFDQVQKISLRLNEWVNKNATYIVTNSHHERNRWSERYPKIQGKFRTIYNGIDEGQFFQTDRVQHERRILCVGSVGPAKSGLCVIEAMNILKQRGKLSFQLNWIGKVVTSIQSRREYYTKMKDRIEKYDLQDHWSWIQPTKDLKSHYNNHDVLVLASTREGLPNVAGEALLCGLPVIISNHLDHPNIVQKGYNGYLFNPSDPNELAEKIEELYHIISTPAYEQMKKNAVSSAKSLFNMERFISKFDELISP